MSGTFDSLNILVQTQLGHSLYHIPTLTTLALTLSSSDELMPMSADQRRHLFHMWYVLDVFTHRIEANISVWFVNLEHTRPTFIICMVCNILPNIKIPFDTFYKTCQYCIRQVFIGTFSLGIGWLVAFLFLCFCFYFVVVVLFVCVSPPFFLFIFFIFYCYFFFFLLLPLKASS